MNEFFHSISTEVWVTLAVIVNQGLSWLRVNMSKKTMSKDVKEIKDKVLPNGGNSIDDKVSAQGKQLDEISKQVKENIALTEAYFTIMMNRDDEALFRSDEKGHWIFCNNKVSDIFGMYHRDMLNKGWEIAIGKTVAERYEFVKAWHEFINDGSPLNHHVAIKNQDSGEINVYLVTAQKVMANGIFQFYLGKIQRSE